MQNKKQNKESLLKMRVANNQLLVEVDDLLDRRCFDVRKN